MMMPTRSFFFFYVGGITENVLQAENDRCGMWCLALISRHGKPSLSACPCLKALTGSVMEMAGTLLTIEIVTEERACQLPSECLAQNLRSCSPRRGARWG